MVLPRIGLALMNTQFFFNKGNAVTLCLLSKYSSPSTLFQSSCECCTSICATSAFIYSNFSIHITILTLVYCVYGYPHNSTLLPLPQSEHLIS